MKAICGWFGIKPQAHYQMKKRQQAQLWQEAQIVSLVQAVRHKHKRLGGRKLLQMLAAELTAADLAIGRDRFFDLLRRHGLLVARKRRQTRTTFPGGWRCHNLLAETSITRPNQAWVCDITYLETEQGFNYLALVTDLFSRRIVGYDLCHTLAVEGALRAFNMAVGQAGTDAIHGLIHHSDHGIQYTCHIYRQRLSDCYVKSSMGQVGNCYDNAVAERVNGILKLEYGLDGCFVSQPHASQAVQEAVWLYNHERPHLSLNMFTPDDVYQQRVHFSHN